MYDEKYNHYLYSRYEKRSSYGQANGENMSESIEYYVCGEVSAICLAPMHLCPHAKVHSHFIGGIVDVDLAGHCTRKDRTTTCVKAAESLVIIARLTGKI